MPFARKYRTKKERCAAKNAAGKAMYARTAGCRKATGGATGRRIGARRPMGDPIVPCALQQADLEELTVPQLRRLATRLHVDLSGLDRPVKADIVAALMGADLPCDADEMDWVASHPQQATAAQLGMYIRAHGEVPPPPDAARCQYTTKTGKIATRRCKTVYVDMVSKLVAEKRPASRKVEKFTAEHYKPKVPVAVVTQKMPAGPASVGAPMQMLPDSPVTAQFSLPEGAAEGAGIVITGEAGEGGAKLAKMQMVEQGGRIVISTVEADKREPQTFLQDMYGSVYKNNPTFIVDSKCAVDDPAYSAGSLVSLNTKRSAVVQNCRISNVDGKEVSDCDHGLIYIEQLGDADTIEAWKKRLEFYQDCCKQIPEYTLNVRAAWTCDSSKFEYNVQTVTGWTSWGQDIKKGSLVGFIAVEIPQNYTFLSLRDFMRNIADPSRKTGVYGKARTVYNWLTNLTWNMVESRYTESLVPDLIELLYTGLGVGPDTMSPETFGVLIENGGWYGSSERYPYCPILMPGLDRPELLMDPFETPYGAAKLTSDRQEIFTLVKNGITVDGMKSSYRPSPGFVKSLVVAGAGAAVIYGGIFAAGYVAYGAAPGWLSSITGAASGYVVSAATSIATATVSVQKFIASIVPEVPKMFGTAWASVKGVIDPAMNIAAEYTAKYPMATSAITLGATALAATGLAKVTGLSTMSLMATLSSAMLAYSRGEYVPLISSVIMMAPIPLKAKLCLIIFFWFAPGMKEVISNFLNVPPTPLTISELDQLNAVQQHFFRVTKIVQPGSAGSVVDATIEPTALLSIAKIGESAKLSTLNAAGNASEWTAKMWHEVMNNAYVKPLTEVSVNPQYVRAGITVIAGAVLLGVTAKVATKVFHRRNAAHLEMGKSVLKARMEDLKSTRGAKY